jgi:hypothetical protein
MDFWRRSARTSGILKVRNEVMRGKMGINSVECGKQCFEMYHAWDKKMAEES